jgi:acyl-CoA synthetase (AMP-forming)/AMP-acid ligase II/acyl carrier protein
MLRKSDLSDHRTTHLTSLAHVLSERAKTHPHRPALTFIDDDGEKNTLSYAGLEARVIELSGRIRGGHADANPTAEPSASRHELQPGDRALLLFPPGLEFMVGFLACQYSRLVPVPTCFPKPGRAMPRLDAAAKDCAPQILLADQETLSGIDLKRVSPQVAALRFMATNAEETLISTSAANGFALNSFDVKASLAEIQSSDLGLLQYTSGSTSDPKGVMVTHANLLTNLESIRQAFGLRRSDGPGDDCSCGVFWLPPFHDMGLIGGILEAIYIGGHTILMSPRSFLAKPLRWLETISSTGATISGAPNFAFEYCLDRITSDQAYGLDLSKWEVAFCGAEPISADSLDRFAARFSTAGFRSDAFIPCYGLAEATLLAASGHSTPELPRIHVDRDDLLMGRATPVDKHHPRNQTRSIVGCGEPGVDIKIEIVDPDNRTRRAAGEIGEVWLQGGSVAQGYWQRDEINAEQFHARLADDEQAGDFLRTGDLGFVHSGSLYVTGRCKDVIILRGRNHFPQDIEATVQRTLGTDMLKCVAVATNAFVGDAMSVVIEVARHMDEEVMPEVVRRVRRQIIEDHEVDARQILLTRPGAIPITTSGKVQRAACRQLLEADEIAARYEWCRSIVNDQGTDTQLPPLPSHVDEGSLDEAIEQIEEWLMAWLITRCGIDASEIGPDTPFADHGLDSMTAVELSGELDDWLGIELTPVLAWNYPTPARLAAFLAEEMLKTAPRETDVNDDDDFERLLAEIEQMPDQPS